MKVGLKLYALNEIGFNDGALGTISVESRIETRARDRRCKIDSGSLGTISVESRIETVTCRRPSSADISLGTISVESRIETTTRGAP